LCERSELRSCDAKLLLLISNSNSLAQYFHVEGDAPTSVDLWAKRPGHLDLALLGPPTIIWADFQNASNIAVYDRNESFVQIGRCDGCSQCKICTRLRFIPGVNMDFTSIQWETAIPSEASVANFTNFTNMTYTYSTDGYCWMKDADEDVCLRRQRMFISCCRCQIPRRAPQPRRRASRRVR